jgi:DNA excision repair protein ERCC-4
MRIVDAMEPDGIKLKLLALGWDEQRLSSGDYLILSPSGLRMGIERKTVPNLLSSIKSGELTDQLTRLLSEHDTAILLLEGRWSRSADDRLITQEGVSGFTWNAVWNLIQSWQSKGIHLQIALSPEHTVLRLESLARYHMKEVHSSAARPKVRLPEAPQSEEEKLVYELCRRHQLLVKCVKHFGSFREVASAGEKELMTVDGIGKKRARLIFELLNRRISDGGTFVLASDDAQEHTLFPEG